MKKILFLTIFSISSYFSIAQTVESTKATSTYRKLSVEPALGTRFMTIIGGMRDVQLTNLVQYNPSKKLNFVAHTMLSFDLPNTFFKNIHNNYSYTYLQQIGVGTTFYKRKSSNSFFVVGGLKHYAYSGSTDNALLTDQITFKTKGTAPDYGLLYTYKRGVNNVYFSGRIYIPLTDGLPGLLESATMELGVGIKIL